MKKFSFFLFVLLTSQYLLAQVPTRNEKAIASLTGNPNPGGMEGYVSKINGLTLKSSLPSSQEKAGEIFKALQEQGASAVSMGNAAMALWTNGRTQIALDLMALVCGKDPEDTDNLNNYASMLTMMGAPELAIPILNNLNGKFKRNSTLLNNLGQAWFALGDMEKAKTYLDSTLLFAAGHPQAHQTLELIEDHKGNKTAAVAHARAAFKQGNTASRKDKLKEHGHTIQSEDYGTFPPPLSSESDLLNLGGFTMPPFPKSISECIALEPLWKEFRLQLDAQMKPLQKITEESNQETVKRLEDQQRQLMSAMNRSMSSSGSVSQGEAMQIVGLPLFSEKMNARENIVLENLQRKKQETIQAIVGYANGDGAELKKTLLEKLEKINEKWKNVGQGGSQSAEGICIESADATDEFLAVYNAKLEELYLDYLNAEKQLLNEIAYSTLYNTYPELQPGIIAGLKMQWLRDLSLTQNNFNFESVTRFRCVYDGEGKSGKLTEFKDPNCDIQSEFGQAFGPIGFSMKLDCSGMTTDFHAGILGVTLTQDLDHASFGDSFKTCTVTIGPKISAGGNLGPLEASVSAGVGADFEIDKNGISDVIVKGGVEAEAGLGPISESMGAEGRVSLNSGASTLQGTGIFN